MASATRDRAHDTPIVSASPLQSSSGPSPPPWRHAGKCVGGWPRSDHDPDQPLLREGALGAGASRARLHRARHLQLIHWSRFNAQRRPDRAGVSPTATCCGGCAEIVLVDAGSDRLYPDPRAAGDEVGFERDLGPRGGSGCTTGSAGARTWCASTGAACRAGSGRARGDQRERLSDATSAPTTRTAAERGERVRATFDEVGRAALATGVASSSGMSSPSATDFAAIAVGV